MSKLTEIFEANIELTEDEVVLMMFQETENSLKTCQSEYRKLATEAGLIVTPAQRKLEWEAQLEDLDFTLIESYTVAKELATSAGITNATATKYLKGIAAENGVELPSVVRSSKWNEVVEAFTEEEALEGDKADVVAKIMEVGDYADEKKAAACYNKLRKAFGWTAPASMSSQLNDWFLENLDATREEIMEKGTEVGMTDGSATYYVGVYKIVAELITAMQEK